MASETVPGPLGEMRAVSTASGGTALSTTAAFIAFPIGAKHVIFIPRNFVTAVVAKVSLNPYLVVLRTQDNLATVTDGSENAQDGDTGTAVTLNSQGTAGDGDYLYVGSHIPFRGLRAIVGNANAVASVLTAKYWNGSAWTNITATDGTASGGATIAVTGNITWTVPTTWVQASLKDITLPVPAAGIAYEKTPLFWVRLEVSVALGASVSLTGLLAMNRSTAYPEWLEGQAVQQKVNRGFRGIGCMEALVDAGSGNLIVNAATEAEDEGFR